MSPRETQVRLSVSSRLENVELAALVVEATLKEHRLDSEELDQISTAIREAMANAIQHGNGLDPRKHAELLLDLERKEIRIRIADEGGGFDPDGLPNPLAPENLLKPHGRGILLMRSFMDGVEFTFDGGTCVTLRKRLVPGGEPAPEGGETGA